MQHTASLSLVPLSLAPSPATHAIKPDEWNGRRRMCLRLGSFALNLLNAFI